MHKLPHRNIITLLRAKGKSPPEMLMPDYTAFPIGYRLLFPFSFTVLYHPPHIRYFLENEYEYLSKKNHVINKLADVIGEGVLTSAPEHWRYHKIKLHEIIASSDVNTEFPHIVSGYLARYSSGKEDNMEVFKKFLVSCLVDINLQLFYKNGAGKYAGIIAEILLKGNKKLAWISPYRLSAGNGLFKAILKQYRTELNSVFDELERLNPDAATRISRSEVLNFLTAAVLTTSANILFILLKLAETEEWQHKFVTDKVFRKCFIMESLRVSPAVWGSWYALTKDVVIDEILYPAGSTIVMHLNAMHKNPVNWNEPALFNPERFAVSGDHKYYFMPFGAGPHKCIGEHSSVLTISEVIIKILQDFNIQRGEKDLEFDFGCIVFPRLKGVLNIDIKKN